jgi:hypothetical protein
VPCVRNSSMSRGAAGGDDPSFIVLTETKFRAMAASTLTSTCRMPRVTCPSFWKTNLTPSWMQPSISSSRTSRGRCARKPLLDVNTVVRCTTMVLQVDLRVGTDHELHDTFIRKTAKTALGVPVNGGGIIPVPLYGNTFKQNKSSLTVPRSSDNYCAFPGNFSTASIHALSTVGHSRFILYMTTIPLAVRVKLEEHLQYLSKSKSPLHCATWRRAGLWIA